MNLFRSCPTESIITKTNTGGTNCFYDESLEYKVHILTKICHITIVNCILYYNNLSLRMKSVCLQYIIYFLK